MVECWAFDENNRPSIDEVHRRLTDFLGSTGSLSNVYLNNDVDEDATPRRYLLFKDLKRCRDFRKYLQYLFI